MQAINWNEDLENEFQVLKIEFEELYKDRATLNRQERLQLEQIENELVRLHNQRKRAQQQVGDLDKFLYGEQVSLPSQKQSQKYAEIRRRREEFETREEIKISKQLDEDKNYLIDRYNPDYGGKLKKVDDIRKALRNFPAQFARTSEYYARLKKIYNQAYESRVPKKIKQKDEARMKKPDIAPFINPFRSKYKNPNYNEYVKDLQIKPRIKKYSKPYFSPFPYTYEIDHLQYTKEIVPYLFVINVNTRYLFVVKVNGKSGEETVKAIKKIMNIHRIDNIRGDADRGFTGTLKKFLNQNKIDSYFPESGYINKNRIVDSAMRTLRNALGPNSDKYWSGRFDDDIQRLVHLYNHSPHKSLKGLTPYEMQTDLTLELEYIKRMQRKLAKAERNLRMDGLLHLRPGNIVMVYLNKGKTDESFDKKRRTFEYLGEFMGYSNGNAVVSINEITRIIPIYWVEYVGESWNTLDQKYYSTFNVPRP